MDAKFNSILNKKIHQKQIIRWSLCILECGLIWLYILVTHMHKLSSFVCHGPLWLGGGGGWCWGDDAQRRALSPWGGLSASLSPAWSFIIYRRDKIKQTQQNGVKSESCSSNIYKLSHMERGCWRCTWSRVCPTPCSCLAASLSKQQSGGNPLLE